MKMWGAAIVAALAGLRAINAAIIVRAKPFPGHDVVFKEGGASAVSLKPGEPLPPRAAALGPTGPGPGELKAWSAVAALANEGTQRLQDRIMEAVREPEVAHMPTGRREMYFRPVSTTLHCVMVLTMLSLAVYTALSISRNTDELSGRMKPCLATQALTTASRTGALPPALALLFLGCRLYILATTQGLGEPPTWAKGCMIAATVGLCLQYLMVLLLPLPSEHGAECLLPRSSFKHEVGNDGTEEAEPETTTADASSEVEKGSAAPQEAPEDLSTLTGGPNDALPSLHKVRFRSDLGFSGPVAWAFQGLCLLCIYGGAAGVVLCASTFPAQATKVSPAVLCTMILGSLYLLVFLLLWICRGMRESTSQTQWLNAALSMSSPMRKAPMAAVLFLASRMRALQLDPPHGLPPVWMQVCFFVATVSLLLEVGAAGMVGYHGTKRRSYYGFYTFHCQGRLWHGLQHAAALAACMALAPVAAGASAQLSSAGFEVALSTAMRCTLVLEVVYFGVALGQTAVFAMEDLFGYDFTMWQDTLIAASVSLSFAPLLCVLFLAARLRALQITEQMGDPQGWAQDCMLMCVFATCVQAVCCLVMPIFIGSSCKVDDEGNPDYDLRPMIGAYAVTVVKYMSLLSLHGGVFAICIGVLVITPETAHGGHRFTHGGRSLFSAIATVLVMLLLALLFSSAKVVGLAVKWAIESCDRVLLGVDITIERAALGICRGYVHIRELVVHQPEDELVYERGADGHLVGKPTGRKLQWKHDYILRAKTVLVKINLWRLVKSFGREFELENLSFTGIHANIEKKTPSKAQDSNVEYLVNHIQAVGEVFIEPEQEKSASSAKSTTGTAGSSSEEQQSQEKSSQAKPSGFQPHVVLHKIALGDMGCGVTVDGVPYIGSISFHPSIGKITFEDAHESLFNGKDCTATEVVVGVVTAIAKKILEVVLVETPVQLAKATTDTAWKVLRLCRPDETTCMQSTTCMQVSSSSFEKIKSGAQSFTGLISRAFTPAPPRTSGSAQK